MSYLKCILCIMCLFSQTCAEERFLLIDGHSGESLYEHGSALEERVCPCSTFKIVLSLMGYDSGVLIDAENPVWDYQEGYDEFLEVWKQPHTPHSWMQCSCIWFSKIISCQLGLDTMQGYLKAFSYGTQDLSVGIIPPGGEGGAWLHPSPLKISPREQVAFIREMVNARLDVSDHAVAMTKALLYKEELSEGWKLYGKTGWSGSIENEYAWFVGWIEKGDSTFPFAYLTLDRKIRLNQRVPRVIELIKDSGVTSH